MDDLDVIRTRIVKALLLPPDMKSVHNTIEAMKTDGTWTDIDYANRSRSAWSVPTHLKRVAMLASAYRAPGSATHGDRKVLAAALTALDRWLQTDPQNPNWWWNRIGVPKMLLPILLLLDDDLSDAQRSAGLEILRRAKVGMTGQNLVWVTEVTAGRGLLEKDVELVAQAYRRIAEEIRVGTGEGIQPDFSFHQHGPCLYNHGYGAAFVVDCARIAAQLDGTALAYPSEEIETLSQLILDGTQWMTRGDATDFGAEGREITRKGQSTSHLASAAQNMLRLSTGREDEFRALLARATGLSSARPLVGNRHFWRADMMVHHRPTFYASARMHSARLANTDGPANSEGLLSHHLADGCFVLMQTGREFGDIYGVWDWQKIPGTTVRQKPGLTGSPRRMGTTDFVGGVSDGTYGMATCDFRRNGLTAKKSWFFFDDEVVCLGSEITSAEGGTVITTLNQCYLKSGVILKTGPRRVALDRGEHATNAADWLWHNSVAYVFLEPATLHIQNTSKSGSWHASNRRYSDQVESRDLFTAWIDHGTEPREARYGYIVAPGINGDDVADYAAKNTINVLANNGQVQAVNHKRLGLTAVAFYGGGVIKIRHGLTIQVNKACLMLAREQDDAIQLTLAHPAHAACDVSVTVLTGPELSMANRTVVKLPSGIQAGCSITTSVSLGSETVINKR